MLGKKKGGENHTNTKMKQKKNKTNNFLFYF